MLDIIKTIVLGRPKGIRRTILSKLFSEGEDTSPNASFSSPMGSSEDVESSSVASNHLEAPKDVTPPEGFEVVLHKDALEEGQIVEVIIAGTAIAVAKANGEIYAFENTCPHAGGPLSEGSLDCSEEHVHVRCPYHGWDFDLKNGSCLTSPDSDLGCYETHLEGNAICVKI